ncbi:chitinase, partial [Tremellales sp. Uapishka_1]
MYFSNFTFLVLALNLSPAVLGAGHRNLPRKVNHHEKRVTKTTTVTVDQTTTHTVWVAPSGQVVMDVASSASSSAVTSTRTSASSPTSSAAASAAGVSIASVPSSSSAVAHLSSSSSGLRSSSSAAPSSSASGVQRSSSSSATGISIANVYSSSSSSSGVHSAYTSGVHSTSTSQSSSPSGKSSSLSPSQSGPSVQAAAASASSSARISSASSSGVRSSSSSTSSARLSSSTAVSSSSARVSSSASPSSSVRLSSSSASASSSSARVSSSSATALSSSSSATVFSSSSSARVSSSSTSARVSSSALLSSRVSSSSSAGVSSSTSARASSTASSVTSSSSSKASSSTSSHLSSSSASSSTSTKTSTSASSTSTLKPIGSTILAGYYPDWSGWYLTPEDVDWSKFDIMDFAFALPTADYDLEFTQDDSSDLLTRLVKTGHAAGKRVKLSIGGWTGSTYFSTICASSVHRATFVSNILKAYNQYNIDGIDIDWEYPGTTGADGNAVSTSDSANFLKFLTELRAALPTGAIITTATQVWPFAGANGSPMSDVSGFAKVIDWILIMNYDVWGSSSTPGANAPLSDACGNSSQPLANAYAAVASWTSAGMPANQITLGVPAYGYLQKSSATGLKDRRSLTSPPGRKRSYVTVYNDNGGSTDGQVMFEELISQGALALDSSGKYVGAGGFTREWDSCSSTPWLKSTSSDQIVTYDDPQSMSLKGQFAAQVGLRGCNMFSVDGDWTGSSWPLATAVRSGLGL